MHNQANSQDQYDWSQRMSEPHRLLQQDVWRSTTTDSGAQCAMISLVLQRQLLLVVSLVSPHTSDMEL